jgi:predicted RNase H-like HicB family nuclease
MKTYTAVIERDRETGYYVGYVPGLPGAHSQGETLDELRDNLREAIELVMEDDNPPELGVEFVGYEVNRYHE